MKKVTKCSKAQRQIITYIKVVSTSQAQEEWFGVGENTDGKFAVVKIRGGVVSVVLQVQRICGSIDKAWKRLRPAETNSDRERGKRRSW